MQVDWFFNLFLLFSPASFYLFADIGGVERGYARGFVDFNNDEVFIKCDSLHGKGCSCTSRDYEINQLTEVSLIGGLLYLAHCLNINKIVWGNVGVARDYVPVIRKKKGSLRISFTELPNFPDK